MKRQRGFTLLEVLIASTILFTTIALVSETFRAAMRSSAKAEGVVTMLTPLPLITSSIRSQLRSNPVDHLEGGANLLGVDYRWSATAVRYGSPAPRFDPDDGGFRDYPPRFRLYDVRLELHCLGQNRLYEYQEVAWEPMRR